MKNGFLFFTVLLFSCTSDPFDLVEVDEFNLKPGGIKNGELVEILYCSGAPEYNRDKAYYVHYIVVKQSTFDTVNVLSTTLNADIDENNRFFTFYDETSDMFKISHIKDFKVSEKPLNTNDIPIAKPNQVVVNRDLDKGGLNGYATVIGVLVTLTKPAKDSL
jgi:hypothetical protein